QQDASNGRSPSSARYNDAYDTFDNNINPNDPNRIVHASVESFHHEDDQYWFTVRVELASGATRNLFRLYENFYDFHIALLEEFPVESGRVGDQPRILPFMPIPLQVVTDTVSASRRQDLDGYVQDLCKLPSRITQHPLVHQLFAVKDGDTETPSGGPSGQQEGRATSPPGRSTPSNGFPSSAPSRNTDRPSPSTGPRAVFASRSQASYRSYNDDPPSNGASPSVRSQATFASSSGAGSANGASEEMIKVKISFQDDIMAMRIPVSIGFRPLQQKIFERLQSEPKDLSYRDERGDFAMIQSDADVRDAIDRSGGKLMIYVD
ncbi:bud emergence protein 1, partial [Podila horticola]